MFAEKFKSKLNSIKSEASTLIDVIKVDEEVRESRLAICTDCPHLFKPTKSCKKCGCFMTAKTWLKDAECPIKKW